MPNRIYFDNSSTSFPKAPGVSKEMQRFLDEVGCNIGRGEYEDAYSAAEVVLDTRERLCRLFHTSESKNVIFTANITQSLNMLIKGFLKPGDHVLTSSMEHNATMRPLVQMEKLGISFSRIPCDDTGMLLVDQIEPLIRPETKAIFLLHGSNVCGTIMPIEQVGQIAHRHGLKFIVDAAQTAGVFEIDMPRMQIDALAFTGHKSLLGPQGIGGFVITDELASQLTPLLSGGTGSISDSEEVPNFLPDRFEAGTRNLPGIFGLHAALCYLEQEGIETIRSREVALARKLDEALSQIPGVRIVGTRDWTRRGPIVSADFVGYDNAEVAFLLSEQFGILTRCGLHCAPSAHKTLGTFPQGTVRFSLNHFNTEQEVTCCVEGVQSVLASIKNA